MAAPSRRDFLHAAGACLAGALARRAEGGLAAPRPASEGGLRLAAVPYGSVRLADAFWAPRQRINRAATVPHLFRQMQEAGYVSNFERAAAGQSGGYRGPVYMDSDLYKSLEAAACCLGSEPDSGIAERLDDFIRLLASAQRPDGYLNTSYQLSGKTRFSNLRDDHELYCAGHLIEAGVAHHEATGSRALLEVAERCARLIEATFGDGPGRRPGYCGHPEIELALLRLSRLTGERRYFSLARSFLEQRGDKFFAVEHAVPVSSYDGSYWLDNLKLREHEVISGHAVRALYLFSAALEVAAETEDASLLRAVDRIFRSASERRMFVTGGLGSSGDNEGFTDDYDLPTFEAYQESCASIAFVFLNQRLALVTGDARYADLVEWGLYNAVAAGVSATGDRFFYVNPLASGGNHHRKSWYNTACCPPNLARLVASVGQYAYATGPRDLYVNLYLAGSAEAHLGAGRARLEVETAYPWDGQVVLTVREAPRELCLRLREPGWCEAGARLRVNGEPPPEVPREAGYLVLRRSWQAGDRVELELPMRVRPLQGHPLIDATGDRLALSRGPIVYCLEQADVPVPLSTLRIQDAPALRAEPSPALGGVHVLRGVGRALAYQAGERLYAEGAERRTVPAPFVAVPYCVWDNRAPGAMRVWLPRAGQET